MMNNDLIPTQTSTSNAVNNPIPTAPTSTNTKKSNAQDPNQSSKGLEYKNLIKEKILKPSKLPEYQSLRKHHSHLVIRDSNYFNKTPSSFIACASCHRGRVLKISLIQDSTTNDILNEIYSIIGVNPCSKKRAKQQVNSTTNDQKKHRPSTAGSSANTSTTSTIPAPLQPPPSTNILNPLNPSASLPKEISKIPTLDDFFTDFDQPTSLPNLDIKAPIKSINSITTITTSSLLSMLKGETNFPTSLDLFLSLGISKQFPNFHNNNDTIIIPLPCISNTRFSTSLDESLYLNDFNLIDSINHKISDFLTNKPTSSIPNLKIIIIIGSFQEGSPQNPQEDQSHKYVCKIILLSDFIINELNNQLLYQTKKFFLNHDYTFIDSKFEWLQSQLLQKLIIKPLQSHFTKKFEYPILGDQISSDVFLNTSMTINVPYIMNSGFYQINHTTSLYIVVYLVLNLLSRFENLNRSNGFDDQMGLMNSLNGIEYNNQFNINVLKMVLDYLRELQN